MRSYRFSFLPPLKSGQGVSIKEGEVDLPWFQALTRRYHFLLAAVRVIQLMRNSLMRSRSFWRHDAVIELGNVRRKSQTSLQNLPISYYVDKDDLSFSVSDAFVL